ncbi:MAG TPA: DUF892 family protein [Terriglobales bacterium]|nr:DUF892 family protein [Terriglobales bacterium]
MLATNESERYILHLNSALAMESALVDHLDERADAVTDTRARQRILQHRDETLQHRATVKDIIVELNGDPTFTKAVVQSPVTPDFVGRVMTGLESENEDRQLREDLADFALENYEAALYSSLALIARNLGYPEHVAKFEAIRNQEQDMADFIESNQPAMVRQAFPPLPQAA